MARGEESKMMLFCHHLDNSQLWPQAKTMQENVMPRRKLAVALAVSMAVLATMEVMLAVGLALAHRPFLVPLISLVAFLPGSVPIAILLWTGRSPSRRCAAR
jgi:hypothetical protein